MLHRRMSKAPSGAGMTVGDHLAGPDPAGAAPGPPTAAGHAQQHHPCPSRGPEPEGEVFDTALAGADGRRRGQQRRQRRQRRRR